jgi:hypothetical protein
MFSSSGLLPVGFVTTFSAWEDPSQVNFGAKNDLAIILETLATRDHNPRMLAWRGV